MKSSHKYKDKFDIIYDKETGRRTGFKSDTATFFKVVTFDENDRVDFQTKKHKGTLSTVYKIFHYYKDFKIRPTNNIFGNILEATKNYNFAVENDNGEKKLFFNMTKNNIIKYKKLLKNG